MLCSISGGFVVSRCLSERHPMVDQGVESFGDTVLLLVVQIRILEGLFDVLLVVSDDRGIVFDSDIGNVSGPMELEALWRCD
jgi:hypothetical protein